MATMQEKKLEEDSETEVGTITDYISSLVAMLREKQITRLEPVFRPKSGFIYTGFENRSFDNQLKDLASLEREGLVVTVNSLTALRCPDCNSYALSCKLACQACGSGNLQKGSVIEHIPCGNVDFDEKYQSDSIKLVCKKCNRRLNAIGVDYSRPGYFYRCMSCKTLLPSVSELYLCLGCGRQSHHAELTILRLPIYVVNPDKLSGFSGGSQGFVNELVKSLASAGIKVQTDTSLKGASQVLQKFSAVIYGTNDIPVLLCDRADQSSSPETAILALFAKSIDVGIKEMALLSSGELEGKPASLAAAYGIKIIAINIKDPKSSVTEAMDEIRQIFNKQKSSTQKPAQSEA